MIVELEVVEDIDVEDIDVDVSVPILRQKSNT